MAQADAALWDEPRVCEWAAQVGLGDTTVSALRNVRSSLSPLSLLCRLWKLWK